MRLQEALNELSVPGKAGLLCTLPVELLNTETERFTATTFTTLQKAVEKYAIKIPFTARIEFAKEINDASDAIFNCAFSKVCRIDRIFDNTEMDILLLKELQGGSSESLYEQTQADRAERFGISTNAIQARIHALENGKEILGHHVKINIAGRGRTAYDNTIHPVFLTLNLKEAYLLTVAMRKMFSGTDFEQLSVDISSDVYHQLSDYARSILKPHFHEAGIEYPETESDALIQLRSEENDAIFYLKSHKPCMLRLLDGTSYVGIIKTENGILILMTADGSKINLPDNPDTYTLEPVNDL